jgi:transcriptional regulator with XRE-family HTH domain
MARGTGTFDGNALRQARQAAGLSAKQLAERVGTSKAAVLAYETGKRIPEADRVAQLAECLNLSRFVLCPPEHTELVLEAVRRGQGLTAAELAKRIGVSRSTYRRLEQEGWLPSRGGGSVPVRLAEVLEFSVEGMKEVLANHPAAAARRAALSDQLASLFKRAHIANRPAVAEPDEAAVREIAELLGHPVGLVCRLVNHELGLYRQQLRQRDGYALDVSYAQNDWVRLQAESRVERANLLMESAAERAATFLVRFLAEALTFREWRVLVYMARRMFTHTVGSSPGSRPGVTPAEVPESFDPDLPALADRRFVGFPLVRVRTVGEPPQERRLFSFTEVGLEYYETTRLTYGFMYPRLLAPPLPRPRRRLINNPLRRAPIS